MKKGIYGLAIILALISIMSLIGCESKEKVALKQKVDSLSVELVASKEVASSINEMGVLIDSIDASRKSLQIKMIEGDNYADYVGRLKDINLHVKKAEAQLKTLEEANKHSSKVSASSIRRLKADLDKRTQEIIELQLQIANLSDTNRAQWVKLNQKDSILSTKNQIIKLNESDIAKLEKLISETNEKSKQTVANLYFAQASALEEAADRTQFAPKKKKETRREALELYKLSLSLGNKDAQARINELEKQLA